jgi:hypothetical protein
MLLPENLVDPPGAIEASEAAGNSVRNANESAEERALITVLLEELSLSNFSDWVGALTQPVAVIAKLENTPPL